MTALPILKKLRQATYHQSTVHVADLPPDIGIEFAFMGRSNAGKSSVINALTGINIAKTSKTPGRTQCMNVFELDDHHRLVDFPGYGYAALPKSQTQKWQVMVQHYLKKRFSLTAICIIMDIRHPNQKTDLAFLDTCRTLQMPIHILLNKADKLSKNQAMQACMAYQNTAVFQNLPNSTVQIFSARTRLGMETLGKTLQTYCDDTH